MPISFTKPRVNTAAIKRAAGAAKGVVASARPSVGMPRGIMRGQRDERQYPTPSPMGAPTPPPTEPSPSTEPSAPAAPRPAPGQQPKLNWNPQLPPHPLGSFTDAQYIADESSLRTEAVKQYQKILRQLGYVDPSGTYVPGVVEVGSEAEKTRLNRELGLAEEQNTNEARSFGTLFSGMRATNLARRQNPYVSDLADLAIETPGKLSELYQDALDVLSGYESDRGVLLQEAAGRAKLGGSDSKGISSVGGNPLTDFDLPVPSFRNITNLASSARRYATPGSIKKYAKKKKKEK